MKRERDHESMSVFEQVMEGLNEGIAHARGELTLKTTTLPAPAPKLTKGRVASIRKKTGMSQAVFARFLNVPKKTLQSWEQGAREPKAGEARLLQLFCWHVFWPRQAVSSPMPSWPLSGGWSRPSGARRPFTTLADWRKALKQLRFLSRQ